MKLKSFILTAAICALCLAASDAPKIRSVSARNALEKRETLVKKAEQEYRTKLVAADRQLVISLDQAVREAMAANDLDEATAINTLKKQTSDRIASEQTTTGGPKIAGTKWKWNNTTTIMTFAADGTVTCTTWAKPGRWQAVDDHTVTVVHPEGARDQVTFATDLQYSFWVAPGPSATVYYAVNAAE